MSKVSVRINYYRNSMKPPDFTLMVGSEEVSNVSIDYAGQNGEGKEMFLLVIDSADLYSADIIKLVKREPEE